MAQPLQEEKRGKGRPTGTVGTKISKLKRITNKLVSMANGQSMEIIQDSLDGKPVDKEKLATAKWTVTSAKEFHKACLQEEESKRAEIDDARSELQDVDEDEETGKVSFSLVMQPKKD